MNGRIVLCALCCAIAFSIGMLVAHTKIFPYQTLIFLANFFDDDRESVRNQEYRRLSLFEHFSPENDYVFVGDSLTEAGEWNEFFPNLSLANRGVNGDSVSDILDRLDSIISVSPNFAFLMIGVNDVHRSVAVEDIYSQYISLCESLEKNQIEVVIQSTIQCVRDVCGNKVEQINKLNKMLSEYAGSSDTRFLSLEELSSKNGLPSKYSYDGIHLNGKGYVQWVDKIDGFMKADLGMAKDPN